MSFILFSAIHLVSTVCYHCIYIVRCYSLNQYKQLHVLHYELVVLLTGLLMKQVQDPYDGL